MTWMINFKTYFQETIARISENKKSIFFYFILPGVFALMYFAGIIYYFHKSVEDPIKARIAFTSSHFVNATDQFISERINEIQNVSLNPILHRQLLGAQEKEDWHYITRQKIKTIDISDEWLICDTLGKSVAANKTDSYGHAFPQEYFSQNHFMEEWFRSGLAASHSNWIYVSEINRVDYNFKQQSWGIDFSTPIKSNQGKLLGVLKYRINWQKALHGLTENITKNNLSKNYNLFIFSKQGDLLFSNNNTHDLRIGKNSVLKEPDFDYGGKHYSSENYVFTWSSSPGNTLLKGDSYFVLITHPKIKFSDLLKNSEFIAFIGIPIGLMLAYHLYGWFRWRKNTLLQISRIKNYIIKLNINSFSDLKMNGSKEFRTLQEEVKKLGNRLQTQKELEEQLLRNEYDFQSYESTAFAQYPILKLGKRLQQLHWESEQQRYISKGVQEINDILYTQHSQNTMSYFCSYIQRYTGAIALGCFIPNGNSLKMIASWGITENPETIEEYNILFECFQQQKIQELKHVPASYLSLNSGLGNSTSIVLTLIPITLSNQCKGVIEVGSIKPLSPEVKTFIFQAGSSLAAHWQYIMKEQMETLSS
jgi:hypothetical protein